MTIETNKITAFDISANMSKAPSLTPIGELYGCQVFEDETMKLGEDGATNIRIFTGKKTEIIKVWLSK